MNGMLILVVFALGVLSGAAVMASTWILRTSDNPRMHGKPRTRLHSPLR